jgi:DNA-binding transcriptional regulator GbsR (MarR family)
LTKVGQVYSLFLLSLAKTTTEEFAAIVPFSGKLVLSGVRNTSKLGLPTFPKTGKLQLHI